LAVINLTAKAAYRHLSPADFDLAYGLAKQITRSNSAKEQFEYNGRFWEILFERFRRPIRWEVFRQLDDRSTGKRRWHGGSCARSVLTWEFHKRFAM
jgi:hypothetical protein